MNNVSSICVSIFFFAGAAAIGGMLACLLIAILAPLVSLVIPIFIPSPALYLVVIVMTTIVGAVIGFFDGRKHRD